MINRIALSFTLTGIITWLCFTKIHITHLKDKNIIADTAIFKVTRDTVNVNINGTLSRGLLINDKYYAFYEIRNPYSTGRNKAFYVIDKKGRIEKEIKLSKDINDDMYYRLYSWNGRIIINTYYSKNTYYLDLDKAEFIKTTSTKIPLFEDELYTVTSDCHGEFGSEIYFKNKQTGVVYKTGPGCPTVLNKIDNKYYIQSDEITEIDDPTKLRVLHTTYATGGDYKQGVKSIYNYNTLFSDYYIPTSFAYNGALYLFYNTYKYNLDIKAKKDLLWITKDTVKIGVIDGNKFKPLYVFKDRFDLEFEQQLSPNYQICTFHTESRQTIGFKEDKPPYREAKYGFIEIMGNKINIHYFISKKA